MIFIVEDDIGIRETISRMIDDHADRVFVLDGPKIDIERIFEYDSVILIIDIALGNTDAIEILNALAERKRHCKVVLISGHSLETLHRVAGVARAMGHTVLGALAKPFRRKALLELLQPRAVAEAPVADQAPAAPPDLLEQALAHGWLEFWFQPQIDLRAGRVCGLEALARVRHPQAGVLPPAAFMGDLTPERKGRLTRAAIDAAKEMGRALRGANVSISLNVFGGQLGDGALLSQLIEARSELGDEVPLTIEITETDAGDNLVAESFSARARLHGLDVSIDDFGAAYATFNRLRSFSFTQLKIERAIVGEIVADLRARSICRASVELAHACNATAVAEGVETAADLAAVCGLGFDFAQGYLFARPMPHEDVLRFLADDAERSRIRELVREAASGDASRPEPESRRPAGAAPAIVPAPASGRYQFLLVEDDPLIADMICSLWLADDVDFTRAASLQEALRALRRNPAVDFDAVILDLNMPDGSGLDIVPNIRAMSGATIIVISGSGTSDSRADAIVAGVDDYVMKPFSVRELKARLLRSIGRRKPAPASDATPISRTVVLDLTQGALVSGERREALSHGETLLLRALKDAEGRVATRQALSRAVLWRDYHKADKSLDVCVSKLRKKISAVDPQRTVRIASVRGFGYKLSVVE